MIEVTAFVQWSNLEQGEMRGELHSASYKTLIELLRRCRNDAGLTQRDVATRLRRPHSFVGKYEAGERRLDVIEFLEIVRALGGDPKAMIDELEADKG